ncbi:MAG: class I SAM-dependent methyltransferase [Acidobacteriota bacterium]|nr:class I SAM-dependent methyltransferase [Acidobacteriota bacterium]
MTTTHWEEPNCPLCNAASADPVYAWSGEPGYRILRCRSCAFFYLSPRPREEDMAGLYRDGAYYASEESGYDDYHAQEQALGMTFRRLMVNLKKRGITGGRLLEVGCGFGYLLREAGAYFDYREATDYSPEAAERADAYADRVHTGGLEMVAEEPLFDLAVANHVIEHVYNPHAFVRDMVKRLKPGGALVLSTPHMGSWWRRCMGKRWPSFKLPEHILYFDKSTLTRLMQEAGLTDLQPLPYPHAFPISLIGSKLGLKLTGKLGKPALWIPGTTLAVTGRKPCAGSL